MYMQDTKCQNKAHIYLKKYLPEMSRFWLANCKIEKAVIKAKKIDKYQSIAYSLESSDIYAQLN